MKELLEPTLENNNEDNDSNDDGDGGGMCGGKFNEVAVMAAKSTNDDDDYSNDDGNDGSGGSVLGACWGTEELGWNERSRKQLRDVRQQSNGFENYEL